MKNLVSRTARFLTGLILAYPALSFITFRKTVRQNIRFQEEEQGPGVSFKEGVYLVKTDGLLALSARCTHLGCTVSWNSFSQRFECPCHGSMFDRKGRCIQGPARKDLNALPVRQGKDGKLTVIVDS